MREFLYNLFAKKTLKKAEKYVKQAKKKADDIYAKMSSKEIREKYEEFSKIVAFEAKDYTEHRKFLPDLLAMIKIASQRTLGLNPYDVQLMGAVVLDMGKIAEMKTGEGKTLTAAIAAIINALYKKPIHIVTVNDYLAKRDAATMSPLYNFFGLDTGVIYSEQPDYEKKEMYLKSIVYATNTELGFDYLRDNLVGDYSDKTFQGERFFCIIDEVDSVLIDEARTPLIISNKNLTEEDKEMYLKADYLAKTLEKDRHYEIDKKNKTISITEQGLLEAEKALGVSNLYSSYEGILFAHRLNNAIYAKEFLKKDKDYIIFKNPRTGKDQIVLIDEFTGRMTIGKSLSDGLHQAIEAKEKLEITPENKTIAKITYPNFFSLYKKVSGMTGTAVSQREEFMSVYGLEVIPIPTNRPVIRKDRKDLIFATSDIRDRKVVEKIKELYKKGQPVLVGTTSVGKSEKLSMLLKKENIPHEVLNAKNHAKEAEIIEKAGRKGAVTIATNMAGRGTDIKLDEEAKKLGGLYVIGVERNESRRIDNQLIGRSGRQGDPGESRFYLSLEDNLLKIFANGPLVKKIYDSMKESEEPLESAILTRTIYKAQKSIEGMHFEIRKNLLEYDNVLDKQRKFYYRIRDEILLANTETFFEKIKKYQEEVQIEKELKEKVEEVLDFIKENKDKIDTERFFKDLFLRIMDEEFLEFLNTVETIREGIHLRSFSQKDPLTEYKKESFVLFEDFLDSTKKRILKEIAAIDIDLVKKEIERQEKMKEELEQNLNEKTSGEIGYLIQNNQTTSLTL